MKKKRMLTDRTAGLEDQYAADIAEGIQKEVDREVLWGMLKDLGWTRVMISRLQDNKHAIDITEWLADNCKDRWMRQGRDFIFESQKDAAFFILKWV